MLELNNVSKYFGENAAVNAVSLTINKGSFVGVIGRSGAGKSTLLRMINRLNEPSFGSIVFNGTDVTKLEGAELREWRR
ncbi:MAG: ATP-binding cassette domain-containing protein, partial [Alphaproteobacteria bacterium]|nr:ATP-binding cassette domain-containing protein [Alphaproteobacteria bacterium]